jgi:hypothetical protein
VVEFRGQTKSPLADLPAGFVILDLWRVTSGHSSPPSWNVHDDGDDDDGGRSASVSNLNGAPLALSNLCFVKVDYAAESNAHESMLATCEQMTVAAE